MVKKIRIEKWELYYMALCMVLSGFWVGYILGGSSSWATKPDIRNEIIPNGTVIIFSLIIIFLLIRSYPLLLQKNRINKQEIKFKDSR